MYLRVINPAATVMRLLIKMALELTKKDFAGKIAQDSGGEDVMAGINKFMGNLVSTMKQGKAMLDSYKNIKQELMPGQAKAAPMAGTRQPPVAPAARPAAPPPPPPAAVAAAPEDNRAKAEALFNELHGMVKPYLPMAKTISVAKAIQYVLQPENKEKIISKFAERL